MLTQVGGRYIQLFSGSLSVSNYLFSYYFALLNLLLLLYFILDSYSEARKNIERAVRHSDLSSCEDTSSLAKKKRISIQKRPFSPSLFDRRNRPEESSSDEDTNSVASMLSQQFPPRFATSTLIPLAPGNSKMLVNIFHLFF